MPALSDFQTVQLFPMNSFKVSDNELFKNLKNKTHTHTEKMTFKLHNVVK